MKAESLIQSIGDNPLPPVDLWDPDYCGEMDLYIKADGTWLYGGTPLTRRKMKLLFSRIIKKEGDRYFLVTPVEKVSIQVEWQPFLITDFDVIQQQGQQIYRFCDSLENTILLTDLSQIRFSEYQQQQLPIIQVRKNLYANFSRNCYYRLVEQANTRIHNNRGLVEITSGGLAFSLGNFEIE